MVVSVLKPTFHRSAPKKLVYRIIFKRELEDKLIHASLIHVIIVIGRVLFEKS